MKHPFCHVQLTTPAPDRARSFYGDLFGWAMSDMPMPHGAYTMIDTGATPSGGIVSGGDEGPAGWLTYVAVEDVDASTTRARELGATVVQAVTRIEGMGAFSILADPTGAAFGLWQEG